jgi:hypothetical protein
MEEEGCAHRFYPKSHISLGEAIDFPRSVCEHFVVELRDRFLRSASEVVMVQPANNGYLVDLAIDLNISRFR